jgi:aminopeptidase-like protein
MYDLIKKLYPICRSITGNGVRETLKIIQKHIPLKIYEVPTGTKAFDWEVPKEWNIRDAYIKDSKGNKIVDFKKCNLHVVSYSIPIHKKMSLSELKPHLFTLPDKPETIPYVTSYYKENWGFCLAHSVFKLLKEGIYEVVIDSDLKNGHLTYGELYIPGKIKDEILFSTYICHPSLINDNLSGPAVLSFLAKFVAEAPRKYSYRFLFVPETIGAIIWLSKNEKKLARIKGGLVATCLGDPGPLTYKRSKIGDASIDRIVEKVLIDSGRKYSIVDFFPIGSDERQFCSPGFNLPIGSLVRTLYGRFPQYHTSDDNLDFVKQEFLADSLERYKETIVVLESNETYKNLNPKCEPRLGKRNLYSNISNISNGYTEVSIEGIMLWVLSFSDGKNSLLDIAFRANMPFALVKKAADLLAKNNLLRRI